MLELLLATYGPSHGKAALAYTFQLHSKISIERNGQRIYDTDSLRNAALHFEGDLYASALAAVNSSWLLHASAVVLNERAVIFAGESGDGKSTICAAMAGQGAEYVSDEWVAIDGVGNVVGMARPIMFERHELSNELPRLIRHSYEFETSDGDKRTYELLQPPRVRHEPTRLGAILRIRHSDDAASGKRRLSAGEALKALWPCTVSPRPHTLQAAAMALTHCDVFDVISSNVDQLCEIVTGIADLLTTST